MSDLPNPHWPRLRMRVTGRDAHILFHADGVSSSHAGPALTNPFATMTVDIDGRAVRPVRLSACK